MPLRHTTDNTLRILDFIGRSDVGVHAGLERPIVRHGFPRPKRFERDSSRDMHGTELPLPPPRSATRSDGAVEYLVEMLRATPDEITLVPVGPLSNIAAALAVDPHLVDAVPEVVIMGGGHRIGNETPAAEFNIWADPEAADMVLSAGFRQVTLVPLDATHEALVSVADCERLDALGTPAGTAAARLIGRRISAYAEGGHLGRSDAAPVHDALCVAYLLAPGVITTVPMHVTVETVGTRTVGRTVMDTRAGRDGEPPNCRVAFHADAATLNELLVSVFAAPSSTAAP